MSRFTPFALLLVASIAVGIGCKMGDKDDKMGGTRTGAAAGEKSLYHRLGGEPAIKAVVDDFVARGAANPKVNFTRKGHPNEWDPSPANVEKLKKRLVEFIAKHTGGPDNYKGRDMVTSHTGMKIREDEFNALAADLSASLDKFKVPAREKGELMAIIASTKGQIVGK